MPQSPAWLGNLSDKARGLGHTPGLADAVIAAPAVHHGLMALTRNLTHFERLGVALHGPFLAPRE